MSFIPSERDYLSRRAHQGAGNQVIATEMESLFGSRRSQQEIAVERQRLQLPPENTEVAKRAATSGGSVDPSPSDIYKKIVAERPPENWKPSVLSATQARKPAMRHAMKKAAEENVTIERVADLPKPEPTHIKINFKPSFVEACVPGKTYIAAGVGAMECTEISTETIAGFKLELITLKELHGGATPEVRKIQMSKFPKESFREPASPEIMKEVLRKLEFGLTDIKSTPKKGKELPAFLEERVNSPNIAVVTDVLCLLFGRSKRKVEPSSVEVVGGNKAIKLIASEYALVSGIDYKAAERLVTDALGTTKREVAPASVIGQQARALGL